MIESGTYRLRSDGNFTSTGNYSFRSNFEVQLPGEGIYTLILDGSSSNSAVDYRFRIV